MQICLRENIFSISGFRDGVNGWLLKFWKEFETLSVDCNPVEYCFVPFSLRKVVRRDSQSIVIL